MINHYEALGCRRDMSREEIKKAYMRLVMLVHPDKSATEAEEATKIIEAWRVLGDEERRRDYDMKLAAQRDRDDRLNYRYVSAVSRRHGDSSIHCPQCGEENSAEEAHERIECVACNMLIDLT